MAVPCPPIHLVAEWTTMSAPYSIGRLSVAAPKVLSTTSGNPAAWAISASASKSGTSSRGLPIVSTKSSRVPASMAARTWSRSWMSTNRVVMPHFGSECANRL